MQVALHHSFKIIKDSVMKSGKKTFQQSTIREDQTIIN
jgi:hypothetical protein